MSVLVFELKEEHVKLLKHLRWSLNNENIIRGVGTEEGDVVPPFGETNLYEAIDLILNGKTRDIDPLSYDELPDYTEEEKKYFDDLYSELPTALDVILYIGSFQTGTYKTRFHLRDWKKIN